MIAAYKAAKIKEVTGNLVYFTNTGGNLPNRNTIGEGLPDRSEKAGAQANVVLAALQRIAGTVDEEINTAPGPK